MSCSLGELIAKHNGKCIHYNGKVRDCCENVKVGFQYFGYTGDADSKETTQEMKATDVNYGDEDISSDNDLEESLCPGSYGCEHDCEMKIDKPTCFCKGGFKLAPNNRSCIRNDCQSGFQFNESTQECEGF